MQVKITMSSGQLLQQLENLALWRSEAVMISQAEGSADTRISSRRGRVALSSSGISRCSASDPILFLFPAAASRSRMSFFDLFTLLSSVGIHSFPRTAKMAGES
jgi:hypothetical protein